MRAFFTLVRSVVAVPIFVLALSALVLLGVAGPAVYMGTHESFPKEWLARSGIYEKAPSLVVEAVMGHASTQAGRPITEKDIDSFTKGIASKDDIERDLAEVFPPNWLKEQAEGVVHAVYEYLHGTRDTITFTLSLQERAKRAQTLLVTLLTSRLASMPDCAEGVGSPNQVDIFGGTCVPRGSDRAMLAAMADSAATKIVSVEALKRYEHISFSPEATEHTDPIRRIFMVAPYAPLALAVVCALFSLLLFWITPGKRARRIVLAALFLLPGIPLAMGAYAARGMFTDVFHTYVIARIPEQSGIPIETFSVLESAFHVAFNDITGAVLALGLLMTLIGAYFAHQAVRMQ